MMSHPRTAEVVLLIVAALAVFLLSVVVYASMHAPIPTVIDDCAAVLTRDGSQVCR